MAYAERRNNKLTGRCIVHHLMLSARECSAEIKLHQYQHAQDKRPCACVPIEQIDVTPHG
jgi:hypothetical protein